VIVHDELDGAGVGIVCGSAIFTAALPILSRNLRNLYSSNGDGASSIVFGCGVERNNAFTQMNNAAFWSPRI